MKDRSDIVGPVEEEAVEEASREIEGQLEGKLFWKERKIIVNEK